MISVILPVHNTKSFIKQCIDSVTSQTYGDIEILAIDSSTDETPDIIRDCQKGNAKIRHITDPNGSYGYKLNLGISEAKGEYIAIVDSDDYIMPGMLEALLHEAEENRLDFVKSDFEEFHVDKDGVETVSNYMNNMWDSAYYGRIIDFKENEELLNKISVSIWTGLYRTSFLRENDIKLHESPAASFQDTGFSVFTHICADRVKYVNKAFYRYRTDNVASSVKSQKKYKAIADEWRWIEGRLGERGVPSEIMMQVHLKKYSSYYWNYARLSGTARQMFACYVFEEIQEEYIARNYRKYCPEFLRNQIREYLLSREEYERLTSDFKRLDAILAKGNVVLAAAGTLGRRVLEYDAVKDINGIEDICDASEARLSVEGRERAVKGYSGVNLAGRDIILANRSSHEQIKAVLSANGADPDRIYVFESFLRYPCDYACNVSVVVPVHNAGKYLPGCLDSLVRQSLGGTEIILVDDGSSDDSLETCNEYARDYRNIKVLHQDNSGVTAARLHGVTESRGKYICFVDSDDWVDPDYVLDMYKEAELYDAGIVCGNLTLEPDGTGSSCIERNKVKTGLYTGKKLKDELYPNMMYYPSSGDFIFGILQYLPGKLFRRDIIKNALAGLNPEIFDAEDVLCTFPMLYTAGKVYVSDCCHYHYRIHGGSECHSKRDIRYICNATTLHGELMKAFKNDPVMMRQVHHFMARYINNASLEIWGFRYVPDAVYGGWRRPSGLGLENRKVAIYGAGKLGRRCYKDIIDISGLDVVAWFDTNSYGKRYGGMEIQPAHRVEKVDFDYIIVAVADIAAFNDIRNRCISLGIPEEKIIAPNEIKFHIETAEDYI